MTCPRCGLPITEPDGYHNLGRCFRATSIDRDRWKAACEEMLRLTGPTADSAEEVRFHEGLDGR